MKYFFSKLFLLIKIIMGTFVLLEMAGLGFALYKAKPVYVKLTKDHIMIKQQIKLDVNTRLPIKSAINTTLDVPIHKRITINLPIKGDINVSIDEPFEIPVTAPVKVALDHEFKIQKDIGINTILPVDQSVQTTLLGFKRTLPIRGEFPVDIKIALDEMVRIKDDFPLDITAPLTCRVSHDLTIPIDIMAKSQFLIDQTIPVPINAEINTGVRLTGELACFLYIDMFIDKERGFVIDHWVKVE